MKRFGLMFFWLPTLLVACHTKPALFDQISSSRSGINFNNKIVENDSLNPYDVVNVYNGGGVGFGDFNNDGLQDIYFTGNMVPCKLYLNKGEFEFEDITEKAGVDGMGRWARGVAVVDINNDGLMDIYVTNTIYSDPLSRLNILYVNQGMNKHGIPRFKDLAVEYGLNLHELSTMANFFDYDNDGDLDMYLTVNEAASANLNKFGKSINKVPTINNGGTGKLYQNNWNAALNHPVFKDVSLEAGLTFEGFGHGATIADINRDGWKDIYVSNDFLPDNILYINNQNGTFTNQSKDYFKHTAYNAMGQDIIDINNDGLSDVVELDMNPEDNYRKKMMMGSNNYNTIQNFELFGNQYQYVRNTLQLNQGPRILENDSVGPPVFSEIAFMSGVAQTDWSWTPLIQDFDNDGFRDMIITNGFPRDVTDHDFIAYRQKSNSNETPLQMMDKIPQVKLSNYAYKNTDGLSFKDVTQEWGLSIRSFSNGAAYADLDNDGDMDMVVNNINDEAFLYRNNLRTRNDTSSRYLQVKCIGTKQNVNGIGAWIDIYYDAGKHQAFENTPYRGYLSTDHNIAHFGLGKTTLIDSVVVKWPDGKKQTITRVKADQLLKVDRNNATETYWWQPASLTEPPLFKEVTRSAGINYTYLDKDIIDFNIQTTLPHKLSEYRPALATADVDGNGLDDIVIAGNSFLPAKIFLQQHDGKFKQKDLYTYDLSIRKNSNDEGLLLFDANGDGSPDLYIASGGYNYEPNTPSYQDKLYINDGKGNFTLNETALPKNYTSKLCVKAMDFNNDGKLDLFVSGRVEPWKYPKPVSSFLFRNDTKDGTIRFTDVTEEIAPALKNVGLVCDALFSDFDNDNQLDLILAGEWMPLIFLKNVNGKFTNATEASGLSGKTGWWNSIVAGDFRHTGRTDYVVGNVGLNTLFQASDEYPVFVTAKDYFNNGSYIPVTSLFLKDEKGKLKEFPAQGRDDIIERMPAMKKRFDNYNTFAKSTMKEIFTPQMREGALRLKANMLQSCYIRNDGNGKFTMIPLPKEAQISTINGMTVDDYDGDGNVDVLVSGNDYGTEVTIGRYDALNGLLLKGDGKGGFKPLSILQSGIYIPGNAKALVKLMSSSGKYMVAASQHKGDLKLFELRENLPAIKVKPDEVSAIIRYKDGRLRKEEFYYGSSFLSQSARYCNVSTAVQNVVITNTQGTSRTIEVNR